MESLPGPVCDVRTSVEVEDADVWAVREDGSHCLISQVTTMSQLQFLKIVRAESSGKSNDTRICDLCSREVEAVQQPAFPRQCQQGGVANGRAAPQ